MAAANWIESGKCRFFFSISAIKSNWDSFSAIRGVSVVKQLGKQSDRCGATTEHLEFLTGPDWPTRHPGLALTLHCYV